MLTNLVRNFSAKAAKGAAAAAAVVKAPTPQFEQIETRFHPDSA